MSTIWKWVLPAAQNPIDVPVGARWLTAAAQGRVICAWAEVDPSGPTESAVITLVGTGHPVPPDPGNYLGSAVVLDGEFVFHVYVKTRAVMAQ